MKKYHATGRVLGKLWMGELGAYPAEQISANSKKALLKKAGKMLKDGTLDSGAGFEYLKGALLDIEEIETRRIDGKEYSRSEFEFAIIGELTEQEEGRLFRCLLY